VYFPERAAERAEAERHMYIVQQSWGRGGDQRFALISLIAIDMKEHRTDDHAWTALLLRQLTVVTGLPASPPALQPTSPPAYDDRWVSACPQPAVGHI